MSDEKSDNVLMFLMVGGVMFASEGVFGDIVPDVGGLFMATRPDNGERYFINLRNCLSVQLVPREAVISGKRIVEPVSGIGGLH